MSIMSVVTLCFCPQEGELPHRPCCGSEDSDQDDDWDSGAFNKGPFDKKPEQWTYGREFSVPGCFTYRSLYSGDADTGNYGVVCVVE